MNIGIEATKAHHKDGGFGVYPRKLIKNLLVQDSRNQYVVFTSKRIDELDGFTNCRQILVPASDGPAKFLQLFFSLRHLVAKHRIDVLHLLSLYGVFGVSSVVVSTVFDLRHLLNPELKERRFGTMIYGYVLPFLLKQSNHLISISEETRIALIKHLHVPEAKITTIHLGHEISADTDPVHPVAVPDKYFLWVGMVTRRKNLETLYRAFRLFLSEHPDHRLVLAGTFSNAQLEREHKTLVRSLGIDHAVLFAGYVSDAVLRFLYQNAFAFVFPSVYEGFGIPIIEAMALGTPVLTTIDGGATREVAGDAALFFHRYDPGELAGKMDEIVNNTALKENLIIRGKERASQFSWQETSRLTLQLYQNMAGSRLSDKQGGF